MDFPFRGTLGSGYIQLSTLAGEQLQRSHSVLVTERHGGEPNLSYSGLPEGYVFSCSIYSHTIHVWYIYLYIWLIFMVNVGKYIIHGWYGIDSIPFTII